LKGKEDAEKLTGNITIEDVKAVVSHPSRWIIMNYLYHNNEILFKEAEKLLEKHGQSSSPQEVARHLSTLEEYGLIIHEKRRQPYIITPKGRSLLRGLFKIIKRRCLRYNELQI